MPTVIPIESKILLDKKPTAIPNIAKANKGTALKKTIYQQFERNSIQKKD